MVVYSQADSLPNELPQLSVPDRLGRLMFRHHSRDDEDDVRWRQRRGHDDDGDGSVIHRYTIITSYDFLHL